MLLRARELEVGASVYLVEDTEDGPRRTHVAAVEIDAFGAPTFAGADGFGQDELEVADDGRRVEVVTGEPGFRRDANSWRYGSWLVVDTEKTGLHDARIVELAAVVMREGAVVTWRSGLYNPGRPIEPGAAAVHGITDAHVASRPRITDRDARTGRTPAEGLDALCAEHDVRAIVAYNGIAFDLPLLRTELGQRWVELEAAVGLVVDPLVVVRLDGVDQRPMTKGRHKLTGVADWLRLAGPEEGMRAQAHRAAWDCVLAGRILWHLREHVPADAAEAHALIAREGARQRAALDAYWAKRGQR